MKVTRGFSLVAEPHLVLGIPRKSSLAQAKTAYKTLVMKYHPDLNSTDPTATEKFREATEAFRLWKKRREETSSSGIPDETGFTSTRHKYDGTMGSATRNDTVREYINFKPLDLEIPDRDRLGIKYKPFFNDQDATHPKMATLAIALYTFSLSMIISYLFWNSKQRDERLNALLYEKLTSEYVAKDWDREELHPLLKILQDDAEFLKYRKEKEEQGSWDRFITSYLNPSLMRTVSLENYRGKSAEFSSLISK